MRRLSSLALLPLALGGVSVATSAVSSATAPVKYRNCAQLNQHFAHGVGKSGAKDHVARSSDKPVRNFTVNTAAYNKNSSLDRDKDGIACEKK